MDIVTLFGRGIIGWLLLTAGGQKLWSARPVDAAPGESAFITRFPPPITRPLAGAEIVVGIALFVPVIWPAGALAAALLFVAFTVLVAMETRRGKGGECGCGGLLPVGNVSYRHAVLTGITAVVAGAVGCIGFIWPSLGASSGGVGGMLLAVGWAPLVTLLCAKAASYLVGARRTRRGIDRRVWGQT